MIVNSDSGQYVDSRKKKCRWYLLFVVVLVVVVVCCCFLNKAIHISVGRKIPNLAPNMYRQRGGGMKVEHTKKITLLSSRFCSASFPVISLISTFLGCVMSVCRSMTRSLLLPRHAESASKSSVLLSDEPSTGQKTPQNFCRGLAGLSEPMLLKKAGTSPAVDMPFGRQVVLLSDTDALNLSCLYFFFFFFLFYPSLFLAQRLHRLQLLPLMAIERR